MEALEKKIGRYEFFLGPLLVMNVLAFFAIWVPFFGPTAPWWIGLCGLVVFPILAIFFWRFSTVLDISNAEYRNIKTFNNLLAEREEYRRELVDMNIPEYFEIHPDAMPALINEGVLFSSRATFRSVLTAHRERVAEHERILKNLDQAIKWLDKHRDTIFNLLWQIGARQHFLTENCTSLKLPKLNRLMEAHRKKYDSLGLKCWPRRLNRGPEHGSLEEIVTNLNATQREFDELLEEEIVEGYVTPDKFKETYPGFTKKLKQLFDAQKYGVRTNLEYIFKDFEKKPTPARFTRVMCQWEQAR